MDNKISSQNKFNEKIKDKIYKCEICEKEYKYYSKDKHLKSQYHKLAEKLVKL